MKNQLFCMFRAAACYLLKISLVPLTMSFGAQADVKTPLLGSGADKPAVIATQSKYLVKIAKANEYGYSVNSLSELDTNGKALVLANSYQINPKLSGSPAQTIVLSVDSSKIADFSEIRVEGRAADVVVLAPKGMTCNGCSVVNAERVTLATGEAVYESGELTEVALSSGIITFSGEGFSASQSSLVDITAGQVIIDAPLTTNMKGRVVTRANKELKEIDPAGTLEVSNGDVQIIVGDNTFRYSDRQSDANFKAFAGNALTLTDKADITVGNLHLESTYENGDISIDGRIRANGAWTYVGRYNNQSIVPLESVKVKSNGNIAIYDQIIAANRVDLESTNDIRIIPEGGVAVFGIENIRGAEVDIAAVGLLENTGAIVVESAYLSANQVTNEGDIEASRDIYINGKQEIKNQFGGVLLGENIHLKSERRVTNGSLYPYRLVSNKSGISAYSKNTAPDMQVGGKLAVPPAPSHMEKVPVDSLEASILGQNIKVEASDFINANPYEVTRPDFFMKEAQLDLNKSGQVIISAESTLDLRLKYRFWNMSSIAESWTGNTIIHAPVIDNERYYIWADTYTRISCSDIPPGQLAIPNHPWYDCHRGNSWKHKQYIKKLSPQAHINTGGNLILKSESFNNEHSAVEVRKDVVGNVTNVWMEGLSLREVWLHTQVTHHSRTYCTRRIFRKCFRRRTEHWTTSRTDLTKNEQTSEYPFVFYVDGHIHKGFGTSRVLMQDITFGPYATSYIPKVTPAPPSKPSKYIPIINSGITFFIPNPNFKE
ncbi:filamentous hemagglutinin N-terminal domain-containing protein [Vibrio coralliilyticus]|uniref:Filamentous haemagglutinin FhaB/tRNA nuclease CdiA-like TPS domain-containing protein n=1 Tax=Vibrio coralliilyticus TaxID=190893 RepID=A0AAN0SDK0_9VIBR|nr:hypothetical protein [Vibrio coralliilyticus]AIW20222.1 hypothetical protein IX92_14815 [Vibrio coralliilyticus]NOH38653.1 filamentous hemagglutinin N-terminal domain-containing protein [Vibrio coralliilyticus]